MIVETYETLMRRALAAGYIADAVGRKEEWLALRMAGRGELGVPVLRHADTASGCIFTKSARRPVIWS